MKNLLPVFTFFIATQSFALTNLETLSDEVLIDEYQIVESKSRLTSATDSSAAQQLILSKCGCSVNIHLDPASFPDAGAMRMGPKAVEYFGKAMSQYCLDDGGPAIACKITNAYFLHKPNISEGKFADGNATISVNGQTFGTFESVEQSIRSGELEIAEGKTALTNDKVLRPMAPLSTAEALIAP